MTLILPGLGRMDSEGFNRKTQEFWTTIAGRKIYAKSLEGLCRTVANGWAMTNGKMICIYCGREWYVISSPCNCLADKGDMQKRLNAMAKLKEIEHAQKSKEKNVERKPKTLITDNGK